MKGMVLICFNLLVILVQKQNPSTVSGKRTVDLAHTLIKAKSPFANILYSKLGKASQQKAQPHLPRRNSDMQFSGLQKAAIFSPEFSSSAASSKESCESHSKMCRVCFARATKILCPLGLTLARCLAQL